MPVKPDYIYADVPHEKTVAGADYRYGCFDSGPRGGPRMSKGQHGWTDDGRRIILYHRTDWLPLVCGHLERLKDPYCEGCSNASNDKTS